MSVFLLFRRVGTKEKFPSSVSFAKRAVKPSSITLSVKKSDLSGIGQKHGFSQLNIDKNRFYMIYSRKRKSRKESAF
jgi:hypothetical protein